MQPHQVCVSWRQHTQLANEVSPLQRQGQAAPRQDKEWRRSKSLYRLWRGAEREAAHMSDLFASHGASHGEGKQLERRWESATASLLSSGAPARRQTLYSRAKARRRYHEKLEVAKMREAD